MIYISRSFAEIIKFQSHQTSKYIYLSVTRLVIFSIAEYQLRDSSNVKVPAAIFVSIHINPTHRIFFLPFILRYSI